MTLEQGMRAWAPRDSRATRAPSHGPCIERAGVQNNGQPQKYMRRICCTGCMGTPSVSMTVFYVCVEHPGGFEVSTFARSWKPSSL